MDARVKNIPNTMLMVSADATQDAMGLDGQPFTGATTAVMFGKILASVVTLAKCVEILSQEVIALERRRTE